MTDDQKIGVYGAPPAGLVDVPADAIQFSPLMPGAASLEDVAEQSLDAITILVKNGFDEDSEGAAAD